MTTTTIAAPVERAAPSKACPPPAIASRRTRKSPTLSRRELRRLVLDLLG